MTRWMRWPSGGTAQGQLDCRGGHPGVLRQHRPGAADVVSGDAHRGPAGLRLIRKWLKPASWTRSRKPPLCGWTPQGAPISPLLANVYLRQRARRLVRARVATGSRPGARRTSCGMPMTSSWGSSTATMRCGSGGTPGAVRGLTAAGAAPGEDPSTEFGRFALANRRKRVGGPTGDVRLPRADALLPDSAGRAFRVGACKPAASGCAGRSRPAQGRVAAAHARQTREDGAVAGAGTAWVAWLLRGSDQLSLATAVRERLEAAVVACPPPEVAANWAHVGALAALARDHWPRHPPSVADGAICRQNSRQEPALTGTPDLCGGCRDNRRPTANGRTPGSPA